MVLREPDDEHRRLIEELRVQLGVPEPRREQTRWVSLRLFVEINGWSWKTTPSVDDAERAVLAVAAGDWNEARMSGWLGQYLARPAG